MPGPYLGFGGAILAFVLPAMGALSAASISLNAIQNGMTDFITEYKAGITNKSEITLKSLVLYFSINQGIFSVYAMIHSLFLVAIAYWAFKLIFGRVVLYSEERGGWDKVTAVDGIRCLLFGIMIGAAGYFSGIALSASAETILMMVGLNQTGAAGSPKEYDTLYTLTSEQATLIFLQEGVQQIAPVVYMFVMELALIGAATLTWIFMG